MDMGIVMDLEKASPRHFGGRAPRSIRAQRFDMAPAWNTMGAFLYGATPPGGKTFKVTSWLQPALAWLQQL